MSAKVKKHDLLLVAVEMAKKHGYTNITRDGIAYEAGVAMGTVTNQLGTMKQIKKAIVRHAIRNEVLPIIVQALCNGDERAKRIDNGLKERALATI